MKLNKGFIAAVGIVVTGVTGFAGVTVTSGDIVLVDPLATSNAGVRFRDFNNQDSGKQVYLGVPDLGVGANRVEGGFRQWRSGVQTFSFEYRPVAGPTDTILTSVNSVNLSRSISDPSAPVNFLSFYLKNNEGSSPTGSDTIVLNLTDLGGNTLSPGALSLASVGSAKWYIADPTLLKEGFILQGSIDLSQGPYDKGERDSIEILFGNTSLAVVPEPSTYVAGALLLIPLLAQIRRMRRTS